MDPFVAEIRIVAFNFAPKGWATCEGQLMPISQNTALFSLLGTTYGGDGQSTFALPNMQDRAPMHPNSGGGGLEVRTLGEEGGSESVTLLQSEIPAHSHQLKGANTTGDNPVPAGHVLARYPGQYSSTAVHDVTMAVQSLPPAGGDQPHNNMMPYLTLNFVIALSGIYPARP
jgi:microcystin-dependent protein